MRKRQGLLTEIAQHQHLVAAAIPQELHAREVHGVLGQHQRLALLDVGIGEIDVEHRVVGAHGRAQQQRAALLDGELQARKKPRVLVIEAQRIAAAAGEIAVMIEQREGIAVLQCARRLVDQRIVRRDVERLRRPPPRRCGLRLSRHRGFRRRPRLVLRAAAGDRVPGSRASCAPPRIAARTQARTRAPIESQRTMHRRNRALDGIDDEAIAALLMISGTEPARQATQGVPHDIASIITSPKGSGQSMGNSSARALPRNSRLSRSPISPTYSTCGCESSDSMCVSEIVPVGGIDFGGDPDLHARHGARSRWRDRRASPARCGPGTPGSRRAAPARSGRHWRAIRAAPCRPSCTPAAAAVADRRSTPAAHRWDAGEHRRVVRKIEPSMHGGQRIA